MEERQYLGDYIHGQFRAVIDGHGEIRTKNPANLEQPPIHFPFSYEHVNESIEAANKAFRSWRRIPGSDRCAAIAKYQELLIQRQQVLAKLISQEMGKPLWEAMGEVQSCLETITHYLKSKNPNETTQKVSFEKGRGVVRHFPVGVAVIISPSILPAGAIHTQFVPALIHGNTVVIKSSKEAPLVGQYISETLHDAGVPSGVVNVIHGNEEVARRLVGHRDVDAIFYTGPYETGLKIKRTVISHYWKRLILEMGGKNAVTIWDDCHYEKALHETLYACFVTSGQRCTSTSQIAIHKSLFDRFVSDFHKLSKRISIGNGLPEEGKDQPFMGPLVNEVAMENYLRHQGIAVREGCEEIMRGKALERPQRGFYVSPSIHIVENVDPKSIYQSSEVMGPNVALYCIEDLDAACEVVNQSQHGLIHSIYSGDENNYTYLIDGTKVGMLNWNRPTIESCLELPYTGVKKSGNHRSMGSSAHIQCTYSVSSIEGQADDTMLLPPEMPVLES